MFQKSVRLSRMLAGLLALVLCLGAMSVTAFAVPSDPKNLMRAPVDLKDENKTDCEEDGFWGQSTVKRKWVKRIEFQDTLKGIPKNIFCFSNVWKNKEVLGWYSKNVLYVGAEGKIVFNPDSSWMFAYFPNLEEIQFNNSVDTSYVEEMDHMFYECGKLEAVDVACFDTSNVKDMSAMFYGCKSLEELDVSKFNTAKVKKMVRMFAYCNEVDELDVSKFDTSAATDLSFMFYCCQDLKSLDVSNFKTPKNWYLNSMFYGCKKLEQLDVAGFDTSQVMGMAYTFYGCDKLKTPDVAGWDLSSVVEHKCFMNDGVLVNGQSWKALFD